MCLECREAREEAQWEPVRGSDGSMTGNEVTGARQEQVWDQQPMNREATECSNPENPGTRTETASPLDFKQPEGKTYVHSGLGGRGLRG